MSFLERVQRGSVMGWKTGGTWNPASSSDPLAGRRRGVSNAFGPITEDAALRQTTVWACVDLVSSSLSLLPIGRFRADSTSRAPLPDAQWMIAPAAGVAGRWSTWMGMESASILLQGNAYGQIVDLDKQGFPVQIEPRHPSEVIPYRERSSGRVRYHVEGESGPQDLWPLGGVFHVPGLMLPGRHALEGLSPIGHAAQAIGTALAAEEFGANFFNEGAFPSGLLEVVEGLDDDESDALKKKWMDAHGSRHREPAVVSGGTKFVPLSLKPDEAQFLETIRAKREEIAGFYRVPLHMIGMAEKQSNWGTGVEENMLQFATFTLGVWIRRFEDALSALLPPDQYVKFQLAALLRARTLDRFRAYMMGRQGGWLSIDEIRALEEMDELPDGKGSDYAQPLNWGVIPEGGGAPIGPADVTGDTDSAA